MQAQREHTGGHNEPHRVSLGRVELVVLAGGQRAAVFVLVLRSEFPETSFDPR